jgi:hypothetical protein
VKQLLACVMLLVGLTSPLFADETEEWKLRQQQDEFREQYDKMRRQHEEQLRQLEERQRRIRQLRRNQSPRPGTTGQGSEPGA